MMQNAGVVNVIDKRVERLTPEDSRRSVDEKGTSRGDAGLSRRDQVFALALFFATLAYLWLFRRYSSIEPDEGIVLQGAQRILRGQVLYRDFFSFLTPGSYYFLALQFKTFGSSFLVARIGLIFVGGIYSVMTYMLARRVCSRGSALFVVGLAAVTTLPYRFEVLHNWDSTLWACLAVYCALRWMESRQWKWTFGTGSLASVTFLFEQSKGVGLLLGLAIGLTAITLLDRQSNLWHGSHVLGLVAGLIWPFVITLAYFATQESTALMIADWFWPLHHYSLANRVPYGYQNWSESTRHLLFDTGPLPVRLVTILAVSPCFLIPLLPLIAVGLLVYWIFQMWRVRARRSVSAYYVLVCAAVSGLLVSVVIGRADIIHFIYLQPLFCLVLAWMVDGRDIPGRVFRVWKPVFIAYLATAFLLFSIPLLMRAVGAPHRVETRRGVIAAPAKDTVVKYVQAHTVSNETILVYPYLPLYYYLTDTYSPTRYEYFQPGMHTPEQAGEALSALAAKRVRVVLFEASFWEKISNSWPSTPPVAISDDLIAGYIQREYHNCQILNSPSDWRFLFMVRKDLPCP
jgi:4-amino-4-deoxy-L-arabinose transferase-like glycosyltransferase